MRATQHPSNNDVLLPPPGTTPDECRPLPITRVTYGDGTQGVCSFWELTDEDRAAIAAGALICLAIVGRTHPPLHLCAAR